MTFTVDPLAGDERGAGVDSADVERSVGLAAGAGAALDGVVAGDEGSLRGLPGDGAGSGLVGRGWGVVAGLRIFGLDVAEGVDGGAAGTDEPA